MQSFTFVLVEFHKAPDDPFFQPGRIPMDDSLAAGITTGPPACHLCKGGKRALSCLLQVTDKIFISCPGANVTEEG